MERVLLWHPSAPATRTNPINRSDRRVDQFLGRGWELWPPPPPKPEPKPEPKPVRKPRATPKATEREFTHYYSQEQIDG